MLFFLSEFGFRAGCGHLPNDIGIVVAAASAGFMMNMRELEEEDVCLLELRIFLIIGRNGIELLIKKYVQVICCERDKA